MSRSFSGAFSAGEITPELFGHVELGKYQQGVEIARNYIAIAQGPALNRPGTELVKETKASGKVALIPFAFGEGQNFVVEVGAGYFRFHANGGTVSLSATPAAWSNATAYEIADLVSSGGVNYYCRIAHTNETPASEPDYWYALPADGTYEVPNTYAAAHVRDIHYTQSADVLTLVHPSYPPSELRRAGATEWTFASIRFTPSVEPPTSVSATNTVGTGSVTYQYVVTALEAGTLTESVSSAFLGSPTFTITAITNAVIAEATTAAAHGLTVGDYVIFSNIPGGMASLNGQIYYVTTVPSTTTFTFGVPTTFYIPFGGSITIYLPVDTTAMGAYVTGGTGTECTVSGDPAPGVGVASCTNDLETAPNKNTISWTASANAVRYNIYKLDNGLFGYIGQTSRTSFEDQNILADVSRTPPVRDNLFGSPGNYPAATGYFEQRRAFAGTDNEPQKVWLSRSGTESNFGYSIPFRDDDRVQFKIAAREASKIRHLVPVSALLALTERVEYRIAAVGDVLTPDSPNVKAQSHVGANNVTPVIKSSTVIFAGSRGGHVQEIAYDGQQANAFVTSDISVLATHLFDQTEVVDMAYSASPYSIIWCVTAHGGLLGLTYVPEQRVGGWHRHDTGNGDYFEAVCCISETLPGRSTAEDATYVVVRRLINGTVKRYVERMRSRFFATLKDCWFLDCAGANFQSGWYSQEGTSITCTVVSHGLTTSDDAPLQFSDSTLDDTYEVTVLDNNRFTIVAADAVAAGIGSVAIVPSAPVSSVTVPWLAGREVGIFADGEVLARTTAAVDGTVELGLDATRVVVGIPIEADLKQLPLVVNSEGYGQGRPKTVPRAWIRVKDTSALQAGPSFDALETYAQRTTEPPGSPPTLINDEVDIALDLAWSQGGAVCIRQSEPLPSTIVSITREYEMGG